MAIYHLHAKIIQRSKGKNVVAAAAYRRAACMYAEKENVNFNYANKPDVVYSEILIPNNSPEWLKSLIVITAEDTHAASEKLWNLTERVEKRKDAQLARELEFALPIELDQSQNIQLAREFIQDQFVLRGMIADFSVHWDEGNPHVHVLLSMRYLTAEGLGQRVTAWNDKRLLQVWREKWAEYANFHLRLHEHAVCIDHRSYEAQGIDLIPGVHQGKAVTDMERRGLKTDILQEVNEIRRENRALIEANPTRVLDKVAAQYGSFSLSEVARTLGHYVDPGRMAEGILSAANCTDGSQSSDGLTSDQIEKLLRAIEYHDSVFSDKDLAKALATHSPQADYFTQAIRQIKASPDLIYLGPGDDGRERYTTRKMFDLENSLQEKADRLRETAHVRISKHRIDNAFKTYQQQTGKQFTDEQREAIHHLLKPSSISCLVGRAGTGKSFCLGLARQVWESQGLKVWGIALSGIAADGLAKEAGIESRTIESFRYAVQTGKLVLNHHSVVVMDEAGMSDSLAMSFVLNTVQEAGAKLVLVGDHAQIQPIGPGASFRALIERLGFAEIYTVYRQKEDWQRAATVALSAGRVSEALNAYANKGHIHLSKNADEAMENLVKDWVNARITYSKELSQYLVIAYRNDDVNALNQRLRAERVARCELAEGYLVQTKIALLKISEGDRLVFLKNDRPLGVTNGRFATVKSVSFTESGKVTGFEVVLDGSGKEVSIDPSTYQDFALGYAATVHKVQGMTVDHAFVYAGGKGWNRHLSYVALSRHRENCHLYADQETHADEKALHKNLGRLGIKDSLLDYPLAFAERRGMDTYGLLTRLPAHLAKRLASFKERLVNRYEYYCNPLLYHQRQHEKVERIVDAYARQRVREDARLVAAYVDARQSVGIAWQAMQGKLQTFGFDAISYEKDSFAVVAETAEYKVLQTAVNQRHQLAYEILQAPERYQKTLELYGLDVPSLQSEAEKHARLLHVQAYRQRQQTSAVVHRDRLAAGICSQMKAYYPQLKSLGVDPKRLRQEGMAHLRREALASLTSEERKAFYTVERYQQHVQAVGCHYAQYIKGSTQITREQAITLESLGLARDNLAYAIMQDRTAYAKALDFYHIGVVTPRFQETPTPAQQCQATKRWFTLQGYAARYEYRHRILQYQDACQRGDSTQRLALAFEIKQANSAHYAVMRQLGVPLPDELWLQVGRDAKRYQQKEFFKGLDLVEQAAFLTVQSYVEAKRSHAAAWREVWDTKKAQSQDDATFYNQVAGFATTYTKQRNALAYQIAENAEAYKTSLTYFKIDTDELQTPATAHQGYLQVEQFIHEKSVLRRAELARMIAQEPKSYYKAMAEQGITWREVYHFACIAERKALFSEASLDEKQLLRLLDKYKHFNRKVGQAYAAHQALTQGKQTICDKQKQILQKDKMQHWGAKRDAVAYRLLQIQEDFTLWDGLGDYQATKGMQTFIEKGHFSWDKIVPHARRHRDRLDEIVNWREDYAVSIKHLNQVISANPVDDKSRTMHRLLDWFTERHDNNQDTITHKILSQKQTYDVALRESGIALPQLTAQQQAIHKIEEALNHWLHLANQQEIGNQSQKQAATPEDKSRLQAVQRIVREAKPVKGTLAERYLREHRGIQSELNARTFLYHPNLKNWMTRTSHPTLLVLARDNDQRVCGLQAIFLDAKTAKKADLGNYTKLSRGFTGEGGLVQAGKEGGKVAFAEGPETALSIAEAKPGWAVYVTFGVGNFDKVPLKTKANSIIICADNDGPISGTKKAVTDAAHKLAERGMDVWVAEPTKPMHQKKWDFNDALLTQGVAQVADDLEQASLYQAGITEVRLEQTIQSALHDIKSLSDEKQNANRAEQIDGVAKHDELLEALLGRYIDRELWQTQLVNAMHDAKRTDPITSKLLSTQAREHAHTLKTFAAELLTHPAVKAAMEKLPAMKSATLGKQGGFTVLQERLQQGKLTDVDKQVLVAQLRNKALELPLSKTRDRDRGGRTIR